MNLLDLVRDFCSMQGLPIPASVVGATDQTFTQLLSVSQAVVRDLQVRAWGEQVQRVTWTSTATDPQGPLSDFLPSGFKKIIPGTFWNETDRRPIFGPTGDQSWQILKAFTNVGPLYQYKIMGGDLYITPNLSAGKTLTTLIVNKNLVVAVDGTRKERFTADSDSPLVPDQVFLYDLEWRWLKQKGEPWAASYQAAEAAIAANINNDSHLPTFYLDKPTFTIAPGIFIPAGSWNV